MIDALFIILAILPSEIFFSAMQALGITYAGADSSSAFSAYMILRFAYVVILFMLWLFRNRIIPSYCFNAILALIAFVGCYAIESMMGNLNAQYSSRYLSLFILYCVPAFMAGIMIINKPGVFRNVMRLLPFLDGLLIIAITRYIISAITQGSAAIFGGATYQSASYYSALTAGINFLFLIQMRDSETKNTKNTVVFVLSIIIKIPSCTVLKFSV